MPTSGNRAMLPSNAELEPANDNSSPPALVSRGDIGFRTDLETNEVNLANMHGLQSELIDEVVVDDPQN